MREDKPAASEKMAFQLALRRRGISDQAVLRAMETVPRERFVVPADRDYAYRDTALGIACGQTISQPFVVAYMTEQLQVRPSHRVLEIGTGSGYHAAVLAQLCAEVVTLERYRTLSAEAGRRLASLGVRNVTLSVGDGYAPDGTLGDFDRILVTAAMPDWPAALTQRLVVGGVAVAPIGPGHGAQMLVRIEKTAEGIGRRELLPVRFVPALPGLAREL